MTRRPLQELSVDAAYRRLQDDRQKRFEAEVMAAPIVDMIGDSRMEYDGPRCPGCGDAVETDDTPCPDCGIGDAA